MRNPLITSVAAAALFVLPPVANAQDAAAGAATGAAVGAGVGGTVGAGGADRNRDRVIIEQRPTRERDCVTNAAGTTVCEEVRR